MRNLTALFLLGLTLATGCGAPAEQTPTRSPAPDFTVTDLNRTTVQLSALRGKVVLIDFWATWCPPCKAEIPHFKELHSAYRAKGLEVIGLSLDQGGPAEVAAFVKQQGILYPVALATPAIVQAYGGIRGIPTTFLVDKRGRIAEKYVGYQDKKVFEEKIVALLAES